jgi:hypothetical protein
MTAKERRNHAAAMRIAEIMYASLQKLPEAERACRIKRIEKIKVRRRK